MKIKNFLWTTPFLCFIAGYLFVQQLSQIDHLETPTLVGRQLQHAVTELSSKNLNLRIITQKEDPDLPHGTILSQTPIAGQQIKPHQSIHVVISKKPNKLAAPLLINKQNDVIQKELEQLNIRNKTYFLPSNKPKNSCIAQFPAPGIPLKEKKITTYFSSGNNKPVLFPDLKNRSVTEAIEFFKRHSVKAEVLYISSTTDVHQCADSCKIVDQRPLTGSIVNLHEKKPILVKLQAK